MELARRADVEVLGVTLSEEQQRLATERAAQAGLSDRVRFELQDYRNVTGPFDRIVSVGMFEHVGVSRYDEFFHKVFELLPDDGFALLHSIGHMSPPSTASPWMRKYIFPGAYSPALSEVFAATERQHLWVSDCEVLRTHYADTMLEWNKRFQHNRKRVAELYDERFCRMWEFYLVSAETMFRTGAQMVFQLLLSPTRDAVPPHARLHVRAGAGFSGERSIAPPEPRRSSGSLRSYRRSLSLPRTGRCNGPQT